MKGNAPKVKTFRKINLPLWSRDFFLPKSNFDAKVKIRKNYIVGPFFEIPCLTGMHPINWRDVSCEKFPLYRLVSRCTQCIHGIFPGFVFRVYTCLLYIGPLGVSNLMGEKMTWLVFRYSFGVGWVFNSESKLQFPFSLLLVKFLPWWE